MKAMLKRFWRDEQGLETVEYAILMALIAAGLVAVVVVISGKIKGRFDAVNAQLPAS